MKSKKQINITNRKARFEYEISEQYEAGIVLTGTEIKSLRASKASITESFCQIKERELFVINMVIDEYKFGTFYNHKIRRERKLLLKRKELDKLEKNVKNTGMTIIPLKLYINDKGKAKILIGLAKGKKNFDKRRTIKERETKRYLDGVLKSG